MDLERANRLMPLVTEGFADSLAEAATRFAISHEAMGTILVGIATIEQFEASLVSRFERLIAASCIGPFGSSDGWLRGRTAIAIGVKQPQRYSCRTVRDRSGGTVRDPREHYGALAHYHCEGGFDFVMDRWFR